MADLTSTTSTSPVESEIVNLVARTIAELQQISIYIQREQVEIDRLKAESQIITCHTDMVVSRLRVQLDSLSLPG